MAKPSDLWYRLGYALESARHGAPARRIKGIAARRDDGGPARPDRSKVTSADRGGPGDEGSNPFDLALAAGASTLIAKAIDLVPARRAPGVAGLARGAAAGALAAAVRMALEPVLDAALARAAAGGRDEGDDGGVFAEPAERLAAGAARGVLYGGLLEPRLPGPPLLRGLTYGTAEWALGEWGGVRGVLGRVAPYRRLPVVGSLLDDADGGEHGWVDHLAFGVALALLYDAGARIGIGDDDE